MEGHALHWKVLDSIQIPHKRKQNENLLFFHPSKTLFIAKMWGLFANASYSKQLVEIDLKTNFEIVKNNTII